MIAAAATATGEGTVDVNLRTVRVVILSGVVLVLCLSTPAATPAATYPMDWVSVYDCTTLSNGTRYIDGAPYDIERPDGYGTSVTFVPAALYDNQSSTYYTGGSSQWIKFQVWAGWQDAYGQWHWQRGRYVTAQNQLGPATPNLLYWVEGQDGLWHEGTTTGPTFSYGGGSGTGGYDMVSVAPLPGPGWYYAYAEIYWSDITDPSTGKVLWEHRTEWKPQGWKRCY